MILNTNSHSDDRRKAQVENYSEVLATLGLIEDEDYRAIANHLEQMEQVHVLVAGVEARRADAIRDAAAKLVDEDVTAAKLVAGVAKIAADQNLHDLAIALWRRHLDAARALTFKNLGHVADVLSAQLADIAAEGLDLADKLAGVQTAEDAIALNLTAEWSRLRAVLGAYAAVRSLVSGLQGDGLIEGPKPTDANRWAWSFATRPREVLPTGYRKGPLTDDETRRLVIEDWRSGPLVARDAEHAAQVVADSKLTVAVEVSV